MKLDDLNRRIVSCMVCPRLVKHREEVAENPPARFRGEKYWAKPLPGFGDVDARILVVGLAPAAHGGNRTGRMFTGDSSGNTLMKALYRAGYANIDTSVSADDGLVLKDVYLTAVVRCPPPANKPTQQEISNCLPYLAEELKILRNICVAVALGRVAFEGLFKLFKREKAFEGKTPVFRHGGTYRVSGFLYGRPLPIIIACYHPSRQNTNTGRLRQEMIDAVFLRAREFVG
ncbi:MAG: uracil-DNA glycosylase [Candidatus Caldarchaeum sp.]|nr:uracil-DNA glycosylase [Candidatus Caldarchaeum sp.]